MIRFRRHSTLVAMLALAVIWSTSFSFMNIAVQSIPPATVTAGRMVLGAAILWAVLVLRGEGLPRDRKSWIGMGGVGLFGNALPFFLITWGQQHIDSAVAAILISAMPLVTAVLAHWTLADERITTRRAVGVVVGFAGIVVLIGPAALGRLGSDIAGEMATLAAAVSFAVSVVVARRYPPPSPTAGGAGSMLAGFVLILPVMLALELPLTGTPTLSSIAATVALAVFPGALAALLYFRIIFEAGAGYLAMTNYLVPLLAVLWGVVLLGEPLTANLVAALVLILAGIALAGRRGAARRVGDDR